MFGYLDETGGLQVSAEHGCARGFSCALAGCGRGEGETFCCGCYCEVSEGLTRFRALRLLVWVLLEAHNILLHVARQALGRRGASLYYCEQRERNTHVDIHIRRVTSAAYAREMRMD